MDVQPHAGFVDCLPAGDTAILVRLGKTIDLETNRRVHALASRIRRAPIEGIGTAVPGYATLMVHYDPLRLDVESAMAWLQAQVAAAVSEPLPAPRRVEVPVRYGGVHGPDLDFVAHHTGLSPEEVVCRHAGAEYQVYFLGFTPGFPYLGGLDPRLATPRLETPRQRVPAGSVGIAGAQTGIYSVESPGGWRLIGWTPLRLFDPQADPPALLAPGDMVCFIPD